MRNQEDKREIITSVRLSVHQRDEIQKKADEHHMSMGSYMVYAAMHANTQFDPVIAVHTQNILNTALRLAKQYEPETWEELKKEECAIWFMSS